jgi:hypothetical protein
MQDIEQAIRERAYHLWLDSGAHDGNAEAHWLAAQRDILSVSLGAIGRTEITSDAALTPKKARASRKKKRAA